jgi:hypothetical protein
MHNKEILNEVYRMLELSGQDVSKINLKQESKDFIKEDDDFDPFEDLLGDLDGDEEDGVNDNSSKEIEKKFSSLSPSDDISTIKKVALVAGSVNRFQKELFKLPALKFEDLTKKFDDGTSVVPKSEVNLYSKMAMEEFGKLMRSGRFIVDNSPLSPGESDRLYKWLGGVKNTKSYNNIGLNTSGDLSKEGNAQLNYLARIISNQPKDEVEGDILEEFGDIAKNNALKILLDYYRLTAKNLLLPILNMKETSENLDLIQSGVEKAIYGLAGIKMPDSGGKSSSIEEISTSWDTSKNVSPFVFQIAKNHIKNNLKSMTSYVVNGESAKSFFEDMMDKMGEIVIASKKSPSEDDLENDNFKVKENPKGGTYKYLYIYDDVESALEELGKINKVKGHHMDINNQYISPKVYKPLFDSVRDIASATPDLEDIASGESATDIDKSSEKEIREILGKVVDSMTLTYSVDLGDAESYFDRQLDRRGRIVIPSNKKPSKEDLENDNFRVIKNQEEGPYKYLYIYGDIESALEELGKINKEKGHHMIDYVGVSSNDSGIKKATHDPNTLTVQDKKDIKAGKSEESIRKIKELARENSINFMYNFLLSLVGKTEYGKDLEKSGKLPVDIVKNWVSSQRKEILRKVIKLEKELNPSITSKEIKDKAEKLGILINDKNKYNQSYKNALTKYFKENKEDFKKVLNLISSVSPEGYEVEVKDSIMEAKIRKRIQKLLSETFVINEDEDFMSNFENLEIQVDKFSEELSKLLDSPQDALSLKGQILDVISGGSSKWNFENSKKGEHKFIASVLASIYNLLNSQQQKNVVSYIFTSYFPYATKSKIVRLISQKTSGGDLYKDVDIVWDAILSSDSDNKMLIAKALEKYDYKKSNFTNLLTTYIYNEVRNIKHTESSYIDKGERVYMQKTSLDKRDDDGKAPIDSLASKYEDGENKVLLQLFKIIKVAKNSDILSKSELEMLLSLFKYKDDVVDSNGINYSLLGSRVGKSQSNVGTTMNSVIKKIKTAKEDGLI